MLSSPNPNIATPKKTFVHQENDMRFIPLLVNLTVAAGTIVAGAVMAQTPEEVLPPTMPWDGASRSLITSPDDPWITPSEQSGLKETPNYAETVAWLKRLSEASPNLRMTPFGTTANGYTLYTVVASAGGIFEPSEARKTGRAIVLAHAGIHSGEIDGKDAGMMLLRDLTVGQKKGELLEKAIFVFVPVLNVDGHERSSPYSRANQRGPKEMGWRTNSRNLNLNRDFAKADTPGIRALLGLIGDWQPDIYVDLHVTDGHDYQYDVTWDQFRTYGPSPTIAAWMRDTMEPALTADLQAQGHIPGLMYFGVGAEMERGVAEWMPGPRYSNGYGAARHLPSVLVENHSLKPYDQRVLGTYVLLESILRNIGNGIEALREAVTADRESRPSELVVSWQRTPEPTGEIEWLGVASRREASALSGGERVVWEAEKITRTLPIFSASTPGATVKVPTAYWIPPAWNDVIELLELHGVAMERQTEAREVDVVMDRFGEPSFAEGPFEGRMRVTAPATPEKRRETYPPGSVRVPTDQPLGTLAVLLLEPEAPDSFFQWGFFHTIFQRTEYVEGYILEPLAEKMLANDPELRKAWEEALAAEPEMGARQRLRWFFERSPYFDKRFRLYPVGREK